MYSHTAGTWKSWTLPPFVVCTWGDSSYPHSNLVNRIIKITHAHNLLVRTLSLLQLVREMTHIVYELICSNDFNKSPPFLTSAIKLCIIQCWDWYPNIVILLPTKLTNCRNADFYSSHVIPLNETISNYFVNWLLPSLFKQTNVTHLYLANGYINYVFINFKTASIYQMWLHLSCRNVNSKDCWTLYKKE